MDRLLRRELDALARDRSSGAAELAQRACRALQSWLGRQAHPGRDDLLAAARSLLCAQPFMVPLVRLANETAFAAEASLPGKHLARAVREFARGLRRSPAMIAREFYKALDSQRAHRWNIVTYSYSSTVLRALLGARRRIARVDCSEGRPGNEGRKTALELARGGITVGLETDAALFSALRSHAADLIVIGADALFDQWLVNKMGTSVLVARARELGMKVWVLADTSKMWPYPLPPAQAAARLENHPATIWRGAPRNLSVTNRLFDSTPYFPELRLLTEQGWHTPAQMRRKVKKIRISRRLFALCSVSSQETCPPEARLR